MNSHEAIMGALSDLRDPGMSVAEPCGDLPGFFRGFKPLRVYQEAGPLGSLLFGRLHQGRILEVQHGIITGVVRQNDPLSDQLSQALSALGLQICIVIHAEQLLFILMINAVASER